MSDIHTILADLDAGVEHVPLGNSRYQTAVFTGGLEGGTPERRARTLLLNMLERRRALREAQFRREELAVTLEEYAQQLRDLSDGTDPHGFQRRRLDIRIRKAEADQGDEDKLIRDALDDLKAMYAEWKTLPAITSREQFEAAEAVYWARRLWADACREIASTGAPGVGTMASLNAMGLTVQRAGADWQVTGPTHLIAALALSSDQPKELTDGR